MLPKQKNPHPHTTTMASRGGKRELLLTEKYEPLAFGGRNAPYLDRISVSQPNSSKSASSSAKWKKLLIQPISIPNLGHTGIKTAFSRQEEALMRPDGSVGKGLRNLIQSTMRDFRRLEEEEEPEYDDEEEDGDYYDDDDVDDDEYYYDDGEGYGDAEDDEHAAKLQAALGDKTKQLLFDSGMRKKAKGIREEKEAAFEARQAEEAAAAAAAAVSKEDLAECEGGGEQQEDQGEGGRKAEKAGTAKKASKKKTKKKRKKKKKRLKSGKK